MSDADHSAALVRARDPDRYLATLYAPAAARGGLFALHALDLELLSVVETTTEPAIGAIRLAWWRERLAELGQGGKPPAQPVLAALAAHGVAMDFDRLDDAYAALLDGDAAGWAAMRGECLFAACRTALGGEGKVAAAGRAWAAVDGLRRGYDLRSEARAALDAAPRRAPRALRPVLALTGLARRDFTRFVTSDPGQPAGLGASPARQLFLLSVMLTGRI